jgi:hypothetical protein
MEESHMPGKSIWSRYSYTWVTLALFIVALALHWLFGWYAFVDEQQAHQQPAEVSAYGILMLRDTFENWQSEFLQLVWQVAGLAFLFHVGSTQSKESEARLERKVDEIIRRIDARHGDETISKLDSLYQR